jgi:hypothetical protein
MHGYGGWWWWWWRWRWWWRRKQAEKSIEKNEELFLLLGLKVRKKDSSALLSCLENKWCVCTVSSPTDISPNRHLRWPSHQWGNTLKQNYNSIW